MFKNFAKVLSAMLIVALIGSIGLFGCAKKEPEVYKIGAILPLTGNVSMLGEFIKTGVDLAVEQVNSQGGVNGKNLEIVYGDSKNDPTEGISVFNKFMSVERLPIVISAMTGVTNAIIPIADKNNVAIFATTVSASGIADQSPWVFRLFVTADIDAKTMAEFALTALNLKKAGILHVNDDFGLSFSKVFKEIFEGKGSKVLFVEGFDRGSIDYRSILLKIKDSDVEAIYLLGYDNNLGIIPKQMRELGIETPILSIGTIGQPNVITQAGHSLNGTYFTTTEFSADSPRTDPAKQFVEKYRAKYEKAPNYFSAFAYDAVMLIANAIKKKDYSNEGIQKGLLEVKNFEGVTGIITIKPNGDADFPMVVKTIKDEKVQDIK